MSPVIDFARHEYRDEWLHHCAIGDPSWDSFVREDGNPIYTGREPYEWPVNGFLFRDPPTGRWYAYVGLYPRGYWPGGPCAVLRECDGDGWEEVGLAIAGDPQAFDGDGTHAGAMPDVSVVYSDGVYHMVYDWANYANNAGGLAYARSDRPEGPFIRADRPLHMDFYQRPLLDLYVRAYAATLIKRNSDWIILHAMSTPGNAGGTWAMACMTATEPGGPYSDPELLLYPQSDLYLPALMEYYPAFAHDGHIYAPATSVARNRSFQCIFRAPIEQAHKAEAWEIFQHGSVWHAIDSPAEAQGIWGQTFSGQVDDNGLLRVYFTSKTRDDTGTAHIALRPWNQPYRDVFVLSAPNAPTFGVLRKHYSTFKLVAQVQTLGAWSITWGCRSPLGPSSTMADTTPHALMFPQQITWRRDSDGWRLESLDDDGQTDIRSGVYPQLTSRKDMIEIVQETYSVSVSLNDQLVCMLAKPATAGRIQLLCEAGSILRVSKFELEGEASQGCTEDWLAMDALAGSAIALNGSTWMFQANDDYRYGVGYCSVDAGAEAKWNIYGSGFQIHAPRGPGFGQATVTVDGAFHSVIDFQTTDAVKSSIVCTQTLATGYHAIKIKTLSANVPLDTLSVIM